MSQTPNFYDLEERTAVFGEMIIDFCINIENSLVLKSIISQLVRSATSIGANYMEANASSSKKDFRNKIYLCKKESQETKHWIRMMARCLPDKKVYLRRLWQESQELTMIFQKITSSLDKREN